MLGAWARSSSSSSGSRWSPSSPRPSSIAPPVRARRRTALPGGSSIRFARRPTISSASSRRPSTRPPRKPRRAEAKARPPLHRDVADSKRSASGSPRRQGLASPAAQEVILLATAPSRAPIAGGNGIGGNANQSVFATLICEAAAPFTLRSTNPAGVRLQPNGDFRIDDVLTPAPAGCASPVLLIRNTGGAWFAAGIEDLDD